MLIDWCLIFENYLVHQLNRQPAGGPSLSLSTSPLPPTSGPLRPASRLSRTVVSLSVGRQAPWACVLGCWCRPVQVECSLSHRVATDCSRASVCLCVVCWQKLPYLHFLACSSRLIVCLLYFNTRILLTGALTHRYSPVPCLVVTTS
jgi:hypothetical protein